jgi:predicted RNase H-like HicB family nuclease
MHFTAVYLQASLGYVGFIEELPGANTQGTTLEEARANLREEELPGANTQGTTLEEARANLREAVELVLYANRDLAEESIRGQTAIREAFDIPSE